jgi:cytochrome c-type biogenesis protein
MLQQYYYWLSALTRWLSLPLGNFADQVNVPLISTLVFGLIGAFAPCQLSTGVAAISYVARRAGEPRRVWADTLAYLAGKASVYLVLGGGLVLAGLQLGDITQTAVPLAAFARKLMGPLLIVVGLFLAGVLRLRLSLGQHVSAEIEQRLGKQTGLVPAYLLGVAFAFTFCPTLFWLFFGLTIPLALATPGGLLLPGVFALGTTLPLLAMAGLLTLGIVDVRRLLRRIRGFDKWAQRVVGLVFVIIGINEIVLYWLL